MYSYDIYDSYLLSKLKLIFNDNGQPIKIKPLIPPMKESSSSRSYEGNEIGEHYKEIIKPDYGWQSDFYTAAEKIPELLQFAHTKLAKADKVIYLKNGIYGFVIKKKNGEDDYYFPQMNMYFEGINPDPKVFKNGFFVMGDYLFDKDGRAINVNSKGRKVYFDMISPDYIRVAYKNGPRDYTFNLLDNDGELLKPDKEFYNIVSANGLIIFQLNDPKEKVPPGTNLTTVNQFRYMLKNGSYLDGGKIFNGIKLTNNGDYIARDIIGNYLFNKDGKKIEDSPVLSIRELNDYDNPKYYKLSDHLFHEKIIDTDGNVFGKDAFNTIDLVSEEVATVIDDKSSSKRSHRIINKDGLVIHDNKERPYNSVKAYNNCVFFDDKGIIITRKGKLKDYKVKKIIGGYYCKSDKDSFFTKYQPVMKFTDELVLCLDKDKKLQLFNKDRKAYKELDYIDRVKYDEHFIYIGGKVYLPYKEQLYNITPFYRERIAPKKEVKMNEDIGELLTRKEFVNKYSMQLDKGIVDVRNENGKIIEAQEKKKAEELKRREEIEQEEILRKELQRQEEEKQKNRALKENYLRQLKEAFDGLAAMGELDSVNRIKVKDLYVTVEDHLEINEIYRPYLKVIDLKNETFKNVKIDGLDFSYTNVGFDPQNVYKKDLSYCDFTGVFFQPFTNYTGVILNGTKLSYDNDPTTIDSFNESIKHAQYNSETRINNKTVEEFFNLNETDEKTTTK